MSFALVVLLAALLTLWAAILTDSVYPWLILCVPTILIVAGVAIVRKALSLTLRGRTERLLFQVFDHPVFARTLAVATMIFLVVDGYAVVRYFRPSPVVLLVPNNRFFAGLGDPVRLDMKLQGGGTRETRMIPSYEGKPLWVGTRKELAVPPQVRQNHQCFKLFHEPELFPGSPIELRPGMSILIELYYTDSVPAPKLYLDPPQGSIVVQPSDRVSDSIQVEEIDGP